MQMPGKKRSTTGSISVPGWPRTLLLSPKPSARRPEKLQTGEGWVAIARLEIPRAHFHVWPIHGPMSFPINTDEEDPPVTDWEKLDEAAGSIRRALEDLNFRQYVTD